MYIYIYMYMYYDYIASSVQYAMLHITCGG